MLYMLSCSTSTPFTSFSKHVTWMADVEYLRCVCCTHKIELANHVKWADAETYHIPVDPLTKLNLPRTPQN